MKYIIISFYIVLSIVGLSVEAAAKPKNTCSELNYSNERNILEKRLSKNGYSLSQVRFLLNGIDRRTNELRQGQLTDRGRQCGIKAVRTTVIACLNYQLPKLIKTTSDLNHSTGETYWNKINVSKGEALVIGLFHACRGAAMETLTTIK